jgi:hypothetical protein
LKDSLIYLCAVIISSGIAKFIILNTELGFLGALILIVSLVFLFNGFLHYIDREVISDSKNRK